MKVSIDDQSKLHSLALIADWVGLKLPDDNSNLAAPTSITAFSPSKGRFLFDNKCVANSTVKRKPLLSRSGYPYRRARLVQSGGKWYIIFYGFDVGKNKLIRKRVAKNDLNDISEAKRLEVSRQYINDINHLLENDAYLESEPAPKILAFNFREYSFLDAINYALAHKRDVEGVKKSTVDEYISTRTTVEDFYAFAKISKGYKLREVNTNFVNRYFDYLKKERKSSNKTYNCRRTILHSTCQVLIKKDPKILHGVNPFAAVPFLKTESRKHAAYSDEQMKAFAAAMEKKGEKHVLLFMQFMYYSLARPEELRNLKVGHILLKERRILFVSQSAKTSIEQYVGINDRFAEIITKSRITEFPDHYYVFSNFDPKGHYPGAKPVGANYFYKRVKKYIKALGLHKVNANYTMYSFKHSGAISLYKATKDIKLLQEQCRHQKIDQTNTYLRDIGLFSDFDKLNHWSGPL